MGYQTVNVRPETHERLKRYKVAGATFDQVLQVLMHAVPPAEVHKRLLATLRDGKVRFQRLK